MPIAKVFVLGAFALSLACAQSVNIVNPDFAAVAIQCSAGFAYEPAIGMGTNCANGPYQKFNGVPGIGWTFTPHTSNVEHGDGITGAGTAFMPPPFTGLPFAYAAFLQTKGSITQMIDGFVPGMTYVLSFYLGSRYANGPYAGNQTVAATIDGHMIGVWALTSFTPFTLRTAVFKVPSGTSHILTFRGESTADNTAFLSGVSIAPAP
jgi:hypothetical protein